MTRNNEHSSGFDSHSQLNNEKTPGTTRNNENSSGSDSDSQFNDSDEELAYRRRQQAFYLKPPFILAAGCIGLGIIIWIILELAGYGCLCKKK